MGTLLADPVTGTPVDNWISSSDDPPEIPEDRGEGDDDWWKPDPDPSFLDKFLYYGSWFLLCYNGFFGATGIVLFALSL